MGRAWQEETDGASPPQSSALAHGGALAHRGRGRAGRDRAGRPLPPRRRSVAAAADSALPCLRPEDAILTWDSGLAMAWAGPQPRRLGGSKRSGAAAWPPATAAAQPLLEMRPQRRANARGHERGRCARAQSQEELPGAAAPILAQCSCSLRLGSDLHFQHASSGGPRGAAVGTLRLVVVEGILVFDFLDAASGVISRQSKAARKQMEGHSQSDTDFRGFVPP